MSQRAHALEGSLADDSSRRTDTCDTGCCAKLYNGRQRAHHSRNAHQGKPASLRLDQEIDDACPHALLPFH